MAAASQPTSSATASSSSAIGTGLESAAAPVSAPPSPDLVTSAGSDSASAAEDGAYAGSASARPAATHDPLFSVGAPVVKVSAGKVSSYTGKVAMEPRAELDEVSGLVCWHYKIYYDEHRTQKEKESGHEWLAEHDLRTFESTGRRTRGQTSKPSWMAEADPAVSGLRWFLDREDEQ